MTVWGICMARDEADIIGSTVTRMLRQVDAVLVADNLSADATRQILDGLPVHVIDDLDPAYRQSEKMTHLAAVAADQGATWVVPFDADEVWYSPFAPRVADLLASLPDDVDVATADLYDHVATGHDPVGADPVTTVGWRRRSPAPLPKVACRVAPDLVIHQGNHGAHYDHEHVAIDRQLVVRHFPYRSAAQFARKAITGAAAYAAAPDLPADMGAHWRAYGALADAFGIEALEDVFRMWFWSHTPQADDTLLYDPCPV